VPRPALPVLLELPVLPELPVLAQPVLQGAQSARWQ